VTTLVLLHGWGAGGSVWGRQVEAFSKEGVTVMAPTFPVWEARWLSGYLKELPLAETLLVGWSLGGMLLLEALAETPDAPAGLILVATPASFCQRPDYPWGQPRSVVRAMRRALREDSRQVLADFATRCLSPEEEGFREDTLGEFRFRDNGADLAAGLDYLLDTDLRPRLSRAPAGVLLVQGDQDGIVPPKQANVLRQYLNNARVVKLNSAGHAPFLTQADAFNEILSCLLYTSPSPRDRTRSRMPSSA